MSILRVGPWSQFGSFINQPSASELDGSTLPVNLANVGWPNFSWRALGHTAEILFPDPLEEFSVVALNETLEAGSTGTAGSFAFLDFEYQATSPFQMTFHWTDSGLPFIGGAIDYYSSISWDYTTIEGAGDWYFRTGGQPSGSEIINLPATRLGTVRAGISVPQPDATCSARLS